jgi:hypothetical protein
MNALISCYLDKCKKENKEVEEKFNSYTIAKKNLVKLYYNEKITKEKFITIMSKISKYHFNSLYYRDFVNCIFKNCYKKVVKQLNIFIKDINYKKRENYTVNDFIKIMIMRNKTNVIKPLVKKYEPK